MQGMDSWLLSLSLVEMPFFLLKNHEYIVCFINSCSSILCNAKRQYYMLNEQTKADWKMRNWTVMGYIGVHVQYVHTRKKKDKRIIKIETMNVTWKSMTKGKRVMKGFRSLSFILGNKWAWCINNLMPSLGRLCHCFQYKCFMLHASCFTKECQ